MIPQLSAIPRAQPVRFMWLMHQIISLPLDDGSRRIESTVSAPSTHPCARPSHTAVRCASDHASVATNRHLSCPEYLFSLSRYLGVLALQPLVVLTSPPHPSILAGANWLQWQSMTCNGTLNVSVPPLVFDLFLLTFASARPS